MKKKIPKFEDELEYQEQRYCLYCKDQILEGEPFVTDNEDTYHTKCWKLLHPEDEEEDLE